MSAPPAEVLAGSARWALVQSDCLEAMAQLGDRSVGHVITDPPYSEGLYARTRTNKGTGLRPNGKPVCASELSDRTSALRLASGAIGSIDQILDVASTEIQRLAERWMVIFSCVETMHLWRLSMGRGYVRTGVWVKTDPMPQITGDRPAQGFEAATIGHRQGRKRWNGGGLPATWIHGTAKGGERPNHPCPKPLSLMLQLVEQFTDPGDIILDPFAGSATTGVACLRLGRRFIGIERSPEFYAMAHARLEAEAQGLTWRDAEHGQLGLLGAL